MPTAAPSIQLAMQYQRAGQLQEAESLYRKILKTEPHNAGVLHLLGLVFYQAGKHVEAANFLIQATTYNPNEPLFHYNLGKVLGDSGKMEEAITHYRKAIALKPEYAEAHINLGNILKLLENFPEAEHHYRQALRLKTGDSKAWNSLGQTLQAQSNLEEALICYNRALQLQPNYDDACHNIGAILQLSGKLNEAVSYYQQALQLNPSHATTHNNLACILQSRGQSQEALEHYKRAIELNPHLAEAYNNLGNLLQKISRLKEAVKYLTHALELKPDYASAYSNLGKAYQDQGRLAEAESCYRKALALDPSLILAHGNLLFMLNNYPGFPAEALYAEHLRWNERFSAPLSQECLPHENKRDPTRRLKIGYVSPDFCLHPVAYFMESVLEAHRRNQVEIYCYAEVRIEDEVTQRFKCLADHWLVTVGMSDAELAKRIRSDQIDILVDLAGHTAGNRLLVFARKPAPVQLTWLGYCNTTGLPTMDYLLADEYVIPRDTAQQFTEIIYRLPQSYLCYQQRVHTPEISPPPALHNGHITLGCFNNLAKVTKNMVGLWAAIMKQLPNSKIVLKTKQLRDDETRQRYLTMFVEQDIAPERVELQGAYSAHQDHFASYNLVDIALDTFPYNGVTTTCDALWMGVPVITLAGDQFISRNSASILTNLGLPELIASTPEQYVAIAAALATDLPRLAELRSSLRARFATSPLGNPELFTHNLEAAFRAIWQEWCKSK